jgi:hypothetical protein
MGLLCLLRRKQRQVKTLVALTTLVLMGCANHPQHPPLYVKPAPKDSPVRVIVDCKYARQYTTELEVLIQNPNTINAEWQPRFYEMAGNQTSQQRLASAKVALWSIRTNCPGW